MNAFNLNFAFKTSKNLSCQNFKFPKLGFIHLPPNKRTFSCPLLKQKCDEINITQILASFHWLFPWMLIHHMLIHEYRDENLKKGFIQHSKSPTSALFFYQKERWFFVNVCRLSWTKLIDHQESVPFAFDLSFVGPF
jgi:hypothetical protein